MSSGQRNGQIYALIEHGTNEIRYVGQTVTTLERRLYLHCFISPTKAPKTDHRTTWILRELRKGTPPSISHVQTVCEEYLDGAEQYWIQYFRAIGCNLTNTHAGGNGGWRYGKDKLGWPAGVPKSDQTKRKLSEALTGRRLPDETRARMSIAKQRDRGTIAEANRTAWREGRAGNQWTTGKANRYLIGCIKCRKICKGTAALACHYTKSHKKVLT